MIDDIKFEIIPYKEIGPDENNSVLHNQFEVWKNSDIEMSHDNISKELQRKIIDLITNIDLEEKFEIRKRTVVNFSSNSEGNLYVEESIIQDEEQLINSTIIQDELIRERDQEFSDFQLDLCNSVYEGTDIKIKKKTQALTFEEIFKKVNEEINDIKSRSEIVLLEVLNVFKDNFNNSNIQIFKVKLLYYQIVDTNWVMFEEVKDIEFVCNLPGLTLLWNCKRTEENLKYRDEAFEYTLNTYHKNNPEKIINEELISTLKDKKCSALNREFYNFTISYDVFNESTRLRFACCKNTSEVMAVFKYGKYFKKLKYLRVQDYIEVLLESGKLDIIDKIQNILNSSTFKPEYSSTSVYMLNLRSSYTKSSHTLQKRINKENWEMRKENDNCLIFSLRMAFGKRFGLSWKKTHFIKDLITFDEQILAINKLLAPKFFCLNVKYFENMSVENLVRHNKGKAVVEFNLITNPLKNHAVALNGNNPIENDNLFYENITKVGCRLLTLNKC